MNISIILEVHKPGFHIHFRIQMTEILKSMIYLSHPLVCEFHEKKHVAYNLRIQNLCKLPSIKTTNFGLESLSLGGSFLWNTLDDSINHEPTLSFFKKRINVYNHFLAF